MFLPPRRATNAPSVAMRMLTLSPPTLFSRSTGSPGTSLEAVQYCNALVCTASLLPRIWVCTVRPEVRQAGIVAAQAQHRLPERLEVDGILLVPVLSHDQLEAAHKMPFHAAPRPVWVLVDAAGLRNWMFSLGMVLPISKVSIPSLVISQRVVLYSFGNRTE